jgi:hypothetical protein
MAVDNLDPEFRALLVQLLAALVPILVTLLSGVAGLLMLEARRLLAERVGQERARTVEHYIRMGVFAAEQYMQSADGRAKKEWVLTWAQAQLKLRGIDVPLALLSELIESVIGQEKVDLELVTADLRGLAAAG